jgi:hypothetical protein
LPAQNAYLDGELCRVLPDGRTAFNLIQNATDTGQGSLVFFLFDLLHLDGENLTALPLLDRKERETVTEPQQNCAFFQSRAGPIGLDHALFWTRGRQQLENWCKCVCRATHRRVDFHNCPPPVVADRTPLELQDARQCHFAARPKFGNS